MAHARLSRVPSGRQLDPRAALPGAARRGAAVSLGVSLALGAGLISGAAGCAGDPSSPPATGAEAPARAVPSGFDESRSGRYHSSRFELSLVLAGGSEWRVDDRGQPDLVAVHLASSSRLKLRVFPLADLANRRRCEVEARARGLVPTRLTVLEESDEGGPPLFDTHTVLALERPGSVAEEGPVRGHVLAFAAHLRRCLIFDFTSEVPAGREALLGDRLAVAAARILPTVQLDPSRVESDAKVPGGDKR